MNCFRTVLLCVFVFCSSQSWAAESDWQPGSTWVFVVGVLEWEHPEAWRAQTGAVEKRRDAELVQFFRGRSVPDDHIVYLQDRQATRQRIIEAFDDMMLRTEKDDVLIVYYAGHGFRDHASHEVYFANYDAPDGPSAWPVRAIVRAADSDFHGNRVLLLADCCYSGGLAEELNRGGLKKSYGCICSSFAHNSSTGSWTFTETLLKGLTGAPACDLDGDGAVEFSELARYVDSDMAFMENQKSQSMRSTWFPAGWRLSKTTAKAGERVGERLEVEWQGQWYKAQIVNSRSGEFKVHYIHFEDSWDEWVAPNRMRACQTQNLAVGTRVQVLWPQDKQWYPAKVLAADSGLHFVHYDGFADEWDEWVTTDLIRKPDKK